MNDDLPPPLPDFDNEPEPLSTTKEKPKRTRTRKNGPQTFDQHIKEKWLGIPIFKMRSLLKKNNIEFDKSEKRKDILKKLERKII
ncbi:hypothetical protein M9Y10_014098 [Tritrichomonas musculus]|uniref:Uncharacterized protein n=1 Tax=Tritrichomonas musculus TaxID=1915356 RepID=A0ABR2KYT3_9EUKA